MIVNNDFSANRVRVLLLTIYIIYMYIIGEFILNIVLLYYVNFWSSQISYAVYNVQCAMYDVSYGNVPNYQADNMRNSLTICG